MLEQLYVVWGTSLTQDNINDLERTQKTFSKLVLKEKYKNYENALNYLQIDTLKQRRIYLSLSFARKCLKNKKMKHLFPPNIGNHEMETRNHEHYHVMHANTKIMQDSPIVYMQNQLNMEIKRIQESDKVWKTL